jgi:hypothetical protein
MRALYPALCAAVAVLCGEAYGQTQWVHERLATSTHYNPPQSYYSYVSPGGVPVYELVTETGLNVFAGRTNVSLQVEGGFHSAGARGVTDDGLPIWWDHSRLYVGTDVFATSVSYAAPYQRGRGGQISYERYVDGLSKAYVNHSDVTTAALGETGEGRTPSVPSPSGSVAWRGRGASTEGYWDMFAGTENMSAFLGAGRTAEGGWVDDAGHVLWLGRAPSTGNRYKVYVDRRDLTTEAFGPTAEGIPRGMNRRGDALWEGGPGGQVMLNTTSVSYPVVGASKQTMAHGLSEDGHVLWSATGGGMDWNLFRDDVNLTATVLGADAASDPANARINATGHVLWGGWRFSEHFGGIFYDTFNLSRDALGTDVWEASSMAIGDAGHCLWWWQTPEQTYEVWLSTPVPEPNGLTVPILLALKLLVRRGRQVTHAVRQPRRADANAASHPA